MGEPRPAVFLDRDGTINAEVNYLDTPDEFRLLSGAAKAIRRLNRAGWPVVVISNQSGIARGYFTYETLEAIHGRMQAALARVGARLDGIYVCPHHPDDGCPCRKPGTALFEQAAHELGLDVPRSVTIGDKFSDLEPGRRLGSHTVLVLTGHGKTEWARRQEWQPDAVLPDLQTAVEWLLTTRMEFAD